MTAPVTRWRIDGSCQPPAPDVASTSQRRLWDGSGRAVERRFAASRTLHGFDVDRRWSAIEAGQLRGVGYMHAPSVEDAVRWACDWLRGTIATVYGAAGRRPDRVALDVVTVSARAVPHRR